MTGETHSQNEPGHSHGTAALRAKQNRALWLALGINAVFLIVEVAGGFLFNSLVLLADAVHMLTDVAGLIIALIGQALITRPATARHTYGLARAEVLAAQANGLLLVGAAIWIAIEAVQRFGTPEHVAARGMLIVATLGLIANAASAWILAGHRKQNVNIKGAFLHMVVDAAGSIGAITAGVVIVLSPTSLWADPAMSILVSLLSLWSGWRLLGDTGRILLEGTPRGLDPVLIARTIAAQSNVEEVHHLHLWNLASDAPALTVHVLVTSDDAISMHDAMIQRERLKELLHDRFGIGHSTIEMECHPCETRSKLSEAEH